MASHTLSLTRWHKVAERLSRTYTELAQSARNAFTNTQVSGYLGETQVDRIRVLGGIELNNLHRAFQLQESLIQIRQAIGEANAKTGVNRELAEYDALMRRHKLLETILNAQSTDMVGIEEIQMLPKQILSEDRYDRTRGTIKVKILSSEAELDLHEEARSLLARSYALSDRISDLNRERLTLELPEDIAKEAGL